ncbi:unnamed protein product [Clonostachys rosea f. rosea IK726]|uniref:Uncharacterized protein n=2 Tax=Bionectria ochroleuca TaxID=29856 RepID=A0ACA9TCM4_BIOOC|nr:unnamed protein product [Clonostachys rosea f. rosea IK726]
MVLDDIPIRPKRPAMPGSYSRGLGIGKHELSTGGNRQFQGLLLADNEPSNSRPLTINSPERFERIQDQDMARNCAEPSNKRYTYPDTFHASSSPTSSDFQKSESGASYSTELSTAPSTSPSPKLTSRQFSLPEVRVDECLSLETHEGNQPGVRDDPYRNPVQIPGCLPPTFVYPHSSSSIRESYHDRFREVVNLFRRNTYEDPKLRESMRFIDYTLKLCGTSPADARPSILAFCRKSDFKALNRLLTNKELKYQYCLRRSSWRPTWLGQETAASTTSDKPLFNLYFWRQGRPRSLFWGKCYAKVHDSRSDAYPNKAERPLICGSIVEIRIKDIQFSTLGCTLQIGSEWYTTTSRHAFRHAFGTPTSAENFDRESESVVSFTKPATEPGKEDDRIYGSESDPSDTGAEDYLIDDIEYESLLEDDEEDDWDEEETQTALDSYWDKINSTHRKGQDEAVEKAPVIFITSEDLDKSGDLDLDWALLKWEKPNEHMWVPNTYGSPSLPSPILLSKVSQSQPVKETSVLVLTSRQSPQHGVLQPGTAMLGGISGRQSSIAWIVLLNEKRSLTYGDSGALVIDAMTNDIYGHVIGCNPLGEIYISPFVSVLQQIRQKFPEQALSLPGPPKMNTNTSATTDDIIELYHSLPDLPKGKGLPVLGEPGQPRRTFTPTSKAVQFQHDIIEEVEEEHFEDSQFEAHSGGDPYPDKHHVAATLGAAGNVFGVQKHSMTAEVDETYLTEPYPGHGKFPASRPSSASSDTSAYGPPSESLLSPRDVYYRQTHDLRNDSLEEMKRYRDIPPSDAVPTATTTGPMRTRGHSSSPPAPHYGPPPTAQRLAQRHSSAGGFSPSRRRDRPESLYQSRYENRNESQSVGGYSIHTPPASYYSGSQTAVPNLREPRGELLHDEDVSYGQDYQARKTQDDSLLVHMDSLRGIRTRHDPYSGSRPIVHQLRPRARDPEMMEPEDEGKYAAAMNYQEYVDSSMPLTAEALWKASIARGSGSNRRSTTSYATSRSSASIRTGRTSQSYDTDITAPSEYGGSDAGTLRSQRSSVDDIGISAARRFQRAPGVRQSVGDSLQRLRAEYNQSPPDGIFSRHDKSRSENTRNLHSTTQDDAHRELLTARVERARRTNAEHQDPTKT